MPIPIQEKAYANITLTPSTVNLKFFEFKYDVFYNFNPNDQTFSGSDYVRICIPVETINAQVVNNKDSSGSTQISWSLVVKNNEDTVLALSSNDWNANAEERFTYAQLDSIWDGIYSANLTP
jgi:hypothetical protein